MKLLLEADQDRKFNQHMMKIQTALGGTPGQKPGLIELAYEFHRAPDWIRPVNSQRAALDQAIADLQKIRGMMFDVKSAA